ncbi:MAG: hypothetical protein H6799_02900 [Candidatus Nomurabacteria bacterium]|nr:MAG: hypothetical protein H6799_02900 [Candidatus Nomurabacteria bacterium]HRV76422.1 hypothetical protein [Candidatus Saccharimonadales bacterium]
MNKRGIRAEELYTKAVDCWKDNRSIMGNAFDVYSEALFQSIYEHSSMPIEELNLRYSIYKNQLSDWIKNKKMFAVEDFIKDSELRLNKRKVETHSFYFGIHVKMSKTTDFIFKKEVNVGGVNIRRASYHEVASIPSNSYLKQLEEDYKKIGYKSESSLRLILKDQSVYFKATTESLDYIVSANKVMSAFATLSAAASIAQERNTKVQYMGSDKIKSRKPIQNPRVLYWIESKNGFDSILNEVGSEVNLSEASLTFTGNEYKVKAYKRYLNILRKANPSPVERRIKEFVMEFDRALNVNDPHLRMLSFWRCIELATRHSNGATRSQKDIIRIISKFSTDDYWKEQGWLILNARNRYVHEGTEFNHQSRDDYLGWLQDYTGAALSQLMWMRSQKIGSMDAGELDVFFNLYTQSKSVFKVARKMSNALAKSSG